MQSQAFTAVVVNATGSIVEVPADRTLRGQNIPAIRCRQLDPIAAGPTPAPIIAWAATSAAEKGRVDVRVFPNIGAGVRLRPLRRCYGAYGRLASAPSSPRLSLGVPLPTADELACGQRTESQRPSSLTRESARAS